MTAPLMTHDTEALRKKRKTRDVFERFEEKLIPEPNSGCWLWIAKTRRDRSKRPAWRGVFYYDGKQQLAPRVSWQIYCSEIPDGLCVLHHCDTAECVNPGHLFLGTLRDNVIDMVAKGRNVPCRFFGDKHWTRKYPWLVRSGENNSNAKLKHDEVLEIRRRRSEGESALALSEEYKVCRDTIDKCVSGSSWGLPKLDVSAHRFVRFRRGEEHYRSKLSDKQRDIVCKDPRPVVEIAAEYGLSPSAIYRMRKRRSRQECHYGM